MKRYFRQFFFLQVNDEAKMLINVFYFVNFPVESLISEQGNKMLSVNDGPTDLQTYLRAQ